MKRRQRSRAKVKLGKPLGAIASVTIPAGMPRQSAAVSGRERRSSGQALVPLLLIAVGVAAYHSSFTGVFVLDDKDRIINNPHIRHLWPPWDVIASHGSRPLVQLSLAANYALGGLDVWGYHAVNLAVHLLAALTLFGIARRT